MVSALVAKYGDAKPLSNSIPSLWSISISNPLPSSTSTNPFLPTNFNASEIFFPITASPAEIVATDSQSSSLTSLAIFFSSATKAAVALSIPRLISIGLAPAVIFFIPVDTIDCASTVAVVVPSPATSLVLLAASFTSCAPMFSNGALSSISLATETPSWTTAGDPHFLSNATLRPRGPKVVTTAFASWLTPDKSLVLALSLKSNCFAIGQRTKNKNQKAVFSV